MKKDNIIKLVFSLFLLCSAVLNAQNSSVEINLKPNSGTNNQVDTDISVSNNLETVNFDGPEITCNTNTNSSGELNYSFTWLGSDFDRDGDSDELSFDLVVGGYIGSTYTYDGAGASGSMTNLGTLSNTTLDYNNANINGWGVSNGDVGPGETLKIEIKNIVISGVSSDYQINFDGFKSADIYETDGGYAHAMVLGQGNNLETYETNSNKTFSFDAIKTLSLTGAGSNVANREWAITGVNFSFSVINSANPNYWNIHDYSDFKTASTYGEAYPDQQKTIRQPTFSWNKVPRWLAVRNTQSYTEEQIEAMAKVDMVMLEKANDAGFNSIEEGISDTAARIKDVNPNSTVLFYWNSVINYGGYKANEEYELNKNDWSIKNDDGSLFLFKDLYYNYNYDEEGLRKWWVDVPVQMAQDPNIDGVFYDKLSQVQFTEIYDDAGTPINNYARMLQDSYNQLPEGKITLGNVVRNEWVAGNRDLMTVFDGSYLERWDLRNRNTTQTQADAMAVSIQLMREALAKGKIINMATHPSHNFLDEPGTDIYGETISADPPTDPDELLQYMKDNIHFPLAVFLIAAEEGAYFSYNLGVNAHPNSDDYWDTGFIDELNYYVGPPLGDPIRNGYLYTRSYENVNVSVNLETKETVLDWIDKTRTESTETETRSTSNFIPDPNKKYYIDIPVHNLRLAATGESEDAYTTSTNDVGNDVEWQFVNKGGDLWHIQRAAGGSISRLRSDNTANADMQATSSDGNWESFRLTEGALNNSYFITSNGPVNYSRLQVDNQGNTNMVTNKHDGSWESFRFTEVDDLNTVIEGASTIVHITKRNATGFAIDGNKGGANGQDIYLWDENENNVNQQWVEIDRGNGYYSYQKEGTDYCIEGGANEINGENVYLWDCGINNFNQHWLKVETDNGAFQLVKRNASGFALNGGSRGSNGQLITLFDSSNSSQNLQWFITPVGSVSAKSLSVIDTEEVIIYPNPVESITTIKGAANTTIHIYDMNGRIVLTQNIVAESEILELNTLSAGIYYVQVNGIQNTSVVKIIKQ